MPTDDKSNDTRNPTLPKVPFVTSGLDSVRTFDALANQFPKVPSVTSGLDSVRTFDALANQFPKVPSVTAGLGSLGTLDAEMLRVALGNQFDYAAYADQLASGRLAITNLGDAFKPLFFESPEVAVVKDELSALHKELRTVKAELEAKTTSDQDKAVELKKAKRTREEIEKKIRLSYLLDRLDSRAHSILLANEKFADRFADGQVSNAYVLSIDIRRSTELMLKASSPNAFAAFISQVSTALSQILKANFGVLDKFTGDGMLGFFPEFYSGQDAGARAVRTAEECHKVFGKLYEANWSAFDTVLLDVGLGIGVDYGQVQLMRVAEGLTVVGRPVVYACRLSGAPAGTTFFNESARSALVRTYSSSVRLERVEHEVKHEGRISVSRIAAIEVQALKDPDWLTPQGS